ncbi:uncharacterized protein N7498_006822 [Penicillium cinerascens]|uniref:Kinesin light chain n=1 Tax=Penicillium cinerascens TaxID=70096 RepID=A0A9W9SXR9_9EURO|nr:uncharacterized protein N7498_006822 [Penicillium cinerascens]KAJ5202159.1 hypothetical protein N7498_006822 [Penicillium cinerascens]
MNNEESQLRLYYYDYLATRLFPLYKLNPEDTIPLLLYSSYISRKNIAKEIKSYLGIERHNTQILFIILINIDTIALANRLDRLPLAIAIARAFIRETGTSVHNITNYLGPTYSYNQILNASTSKLKCPNLAEKDNIKCTSVQSYREKNIDPLYLNALALISIRYTVPRVDNRKYLELQQRLLPHAKYVGHKDWLEENIRKSLAGKERVLGQNHPSTLDIVSDLGNLYRERGKLEEVEDIYQRAIASYKEALGPDHLSTFKAVGNLGNLYRDQGKLKEAKEIYQQALASKERVLGRENTRPRFGSGLGPTSGPVPAGRVHTQYPKPIPVDPWVLGGYPRVTRQEPVLA